MAGGPGNGDTEEIGAPKPEGREAVEIRLNERPENQDGQGDLEHEFAKAIADREVARSRRDRAEGFVRGYERVEGLFRQNASGLAIALASAGNVVGDVGRGLEEIFD